MLGTGVCVDLGVWVLCKCGCLCGGVWVSVCACGCVGSVLVYGCVGNV